MYFQRPQKHSLTLNGHRTSVSLEDDFWQAFRLIAETKQRPINELAAEIDTLREADCGLASAIRLYVLDALRTQITEGSIATSPHSPNAQ